MRNVFTAAFNSLDPSGVYDVETSAVPPELESAANIYDVGATCLVEGISGADALRILWPEGAKAFGPLKPPPEESGEDWPDDEFPTLPEGEEEQDDWEDVLPAVADVAKGAT